MDVSEYSYTPKYRDEEFLREQTRLGKGPKQIAEEVGRVSRSTVVRWLREYGLSEPQHGGHEPQTAESFTRACKTAARDDVPRHDRETLYELYWGELLSCTEIGEQYDVPEQTIHSWLKNNDVPTRPRTTKDHEHWKYDKGEWDKEADEWVGADGWVWTGPIPDYEDTEIPDSDPSDDLPSYLNEEPAEGVEWTLLRDA